MGWQPEADPPTPGLVVVTGGGYARGGHWSERRVLRAPAQSVQSAHVQVREIAASLVGPPWCSVRDTPQAFVVTLWVENVRVTASSASPGALIREWSKAGGGDDGAVEVASQHGAVVRGISVGVDATVRGGDPVTATVSVGEDGRGRVEPAHRAHGSAP